MSEHNGTGKPQAQAGGVRKGVLKLSDDSLKLRKVARSWREGQVSREDYRAIRAATLQSMLGETVADPTRVDDSEPENTLTGQLPDGEQLVERDAPGSVMIIIAVAALLLLAGTAALLSL